MILNDRSSARVQLRRTLIAILILFPALTNLVAHTGSVYLAALTAAGLPMLLIAHLRPSLAPHERWVLWAFVAYTFAQLLSFGINGLLDTLSDPRLRHLDHASRFLAIIPLLFLFRCAKIPQAVLWAGVLVGAWVAGGYALISHLWLAMGARVSGSYHAIAFGHLSLVLAFMSIPALDVFKNKNPLLRLIPLSAFLLGMTASILSETRGAWIAIPALTVILFFYSAAMIRLKHRLACAGVIILSLLAVYQIPATNVAERVDTALKEFAAYRQGDRTYSSSASRIQGWAVSLEIFKASPVIGAGPGSYEPLMHRMHQQGKDYAIAAVHSQPHSVYALAMADGGLLGLLALIGVFALPMAASIRCIRSGPQTRHIGYAWMILVISFMHFGLSETIFIRNINVTFYLIQTAVLMAVAASQMQRAVANTPDSQ